MTKLEKLIKEATTDTSWREEFQYQFENEEAEDLAFELKLQSIIDNEINQ